MTTAEIIESELRRLCPQMSGVDVVAAKVAVAIAEEHLERQRYCGYPA